MDFNLIYKKLTKWENCGFKTMENGARVICKVPHVAEQAWLHRIYAPKKFQEIQALEQSLGMPLPKDLKEFFSYANGINIFSDSLSVWGIRDSYLRTIEDSFQPYDLYQAHKEEESKLSYSTVIFGSYNWDGSLMIYDCSQHKVLRCEGDKLTPLQEWQNLWIWLESELDRLSLLFDECGVLYDLDQPTTP